MRIKNLKRAKRLIEDNIDNYENCYLGPALLEFIADILNEKNDVNKAEEILAFIKKKDRLNNTNKAEKFIKKLNISF